jgi:hypothetical protein
MWGRFSVAATGFEIGTMSPRDSQVDQRKNFGTANKRK